MLSAIGRYDGVLGATTASDILGPSAPIQGTLRLRVIGAPEDAQARFEEYAAAMLLPAAMETQIEEGAHVEVRFDDEPSKTAFLAFQGVAPEPGRLLVVTAHVRTHRPVVYDDARAAAEPVIFLDSWESHTPLVFK